MKRLILVLFLFVFALQLNATTYYVATNGSDGNTGTISSCWLTLQKAANTAIPGDIIIFKDGTYYFTGATMATITTSGNSGEYITYKAQNKGGAILDGSNNAATFCISISASYINIEGFEIRNFSHDAIATPLNSSNSYVNLRDLHIHNCGRICIPSSDQNYQVGVGGTYFRSMNHVIVERCIFHDLGRLSRAEGCSTTGTDLNFDHALYIANCDNWVIQNNIFYNCQRGFGVQLYDGAGGVDSNFTIINNTFIDGNQSHPAGHLILWTNLSNILIANNIFDGQANYAIQLYQAEYTTSNVVIANNIEYGGNNQLIFYTTLQGTALSNNHENTNPMFVNRSSKDLHLQSGSPAINAGYSVGLSTDYDQNARSGVIDIGALEYVSGVTTYYNVSASGTATKNNCGTGYAGTTVTYTVAANMYSSTASQIAADNLATSDVANNKQPYANANGTCTQTNTNVHGILVNKKNVPLVRNNRPFVR